MLVRVVVPFRQFFPNASGNPQDRAYRDLPRGFEVDLDDADAAVLIDEGRAVAVVTEVAPIPDTVTPDEE